MRKARIISLLAGASMMGIGLKLATLLFQAHNVDGYVILPFFPNILDAAVVAAGAAWMLYTSTQKEDEEVKA